MAEIDLDSLEPPPPGAQGNRVLTGYTGNRLDRRRGRQGHGRGVNGAVSRRDRSVAAVRRGDAGLAEVSDAPFFLPLVAWGPLSGCRGWDMSAKARSAPCRRSSSAAPGAGEMSSGGARGGRMTSAVSAAAPDAGAGMAATLIAAVRSAAELVSAAGSVLLHSSAVSARAATEAADTPANAMTQEARRWMRPARACSTASTRAISSR